MVKLLNRLTIKIHSDSQKRRYALFFSSGDFGCYVSRDGRPDLYRITRKLKWVLDRLHGFAYNPIGQVELEAAERFLLTFALMEKLIRRTLTELIQIKDGQMSKHDITEKQKKVS